MSLEPILPDSPSVTGLLASPAGALLCASPVGPTTGPSGPAPVPVSPSPALAKEKENQTPGISGRNFTGSSNPVGQKQCLESKSLQPMSLEEHRKRDRDYQKRYRYKNRARDLVRHARFRAHKKKLPFDLLDHLLEIQERIDRGLCEISGLPLNLNGGRTWDSPSLDRKDPKLGYTVSNIRVVCHAVNSALGDWGEVKLLEIARAISTKRREASNSLSKRIGENLKKRLSAYGSPEYALTWKEQVTPSGHLIYRLRASALRTSDSAFGGWPSPTKGNADGSQMAKGASATGRRPDGSKATVSLNHVASLAGWPSPQVSDSLGGGSITEASRKANRQKRPSGASIGSKLRNEVLLAGSGVSETGLVALTVGKGQLNPAHSRWLQGYPVEWDRAGILAYRSIPKHARKVAS